MVSLSQPPKVKLDCTNKGDSMASEKVAEKIPSWIKQVLIPELTEIKGEIRAVNNRIDSFDDKMDTRLNALDGKIDSLRNETKSEIIRLEERIDSLRNETKMEIGSLRTEITVKFDSLEKRIPVIGNHSP